MQRIASGSIHKGTPSGETIYIGSPRSQTLLRIYDKRLELQAKEQEDWQDYGIRWELELKKDRAQVCGQALSFLEEADWLEFKEAQTLAMVKLWVSRSIAPTLAMCVEHPGGQAWLEDVLVVGKCRLKEKHRRLLDTPQRAGRSTSHHETAGWRFNSSRQLHKFR
jgi:hypothetical protein